MRISWHHIRRSMAEVLRNPESAASIWDEHAAIIDAIVTGDVVTAEATIKEHIESAYQRNYALASHLEP